MRYRASGRRFQSCSPKASRADNTACRERAIRNSSKSRDIVLDPFGGSGTTMIAAEHAGRRARLIELDPKYVDVIVQRWQDQTGQAAKLESSGQSFSDIAFKKGEPV